MYCCLYSFNCDRIPYVDATADLAVVATQMYSRRLSIMQTWMIVLIVVTVILVAVVAVLYYLGKKAQKKQDEQQELLEANKQTVSIGPPSPPALARR